MLAKTIKRNNIVAILNAIVAILSVKSVKKLNYYCTTYQLVHVCYAM